MRLALLTTVLTLAACVGDAPFQTADGGAGDLASLVGHDGGAGSDDLARPAPDLSGLDLVGLVNCYDVNICDPSMDFCIRYFTGSMSTPGALSTPPGCFDPDPSCGDQGQNMDCGCIQNDANLGLNCQGGCVDHGDGTFDCYAQ